MKDDAKRHRFVVNGHGRAVDALEPVVRAEVESEFAERLKDASYWRRVLLRREMRAELKRRMHEKAPPDALY